MSKINNSKFKEDIKNGFNSFEPENNGIIETKQLNSINKLMNLNKKNHFLYNSINQLTSKKNDEYITSKEYISYFDEQLNDNNSKEGLEKIFKVFSDGNKKNISWTKLPLVAKELGDEELAKNLMILLEQAKLFNKELSFEEFCEIMDESYDKNIKSPNESDDIELKETYKTKKLKKNKKEEEEEMGTISSKNEDSKKSIEEAEGEISSKRYHRRYRDTKNKSENNDTGNNINNKTHTKYRKKK